MKPYRRSPIVALAMAVFVVALVSSSCARRGLLAGTADAVAASATPGLVAAPTGTPSVEPTAVPTQTATPVPSPDLSAVDGLIKDIANDLDADASAGADEGSTP